MDIPHPLIETTTIAATNLQAIEFQNIMDP